MSLPSTMGFRPTIVEQHFKSHEACKVNSSSTKSNGVVGSLRMFRRPGRQKWLGSWERGVADRCHYCLDATLFDDLWKGEPCYSFACPWKATATLPLAPAPEAPKASVSPLCDRYVSPLLTLVSVRRVAWDSARGSSGDSSRNWNQAANIRDSQLGITIPICWRLHLESSTRWSARKSNTLVI